MVSDLECEAEEDGADAEAGAQVFGGEDAGEEADERDEMRDDAVRIAGEDGDAEEDDIAGHGVGEDMAVVEVDDGVEQAAGGGQEHGVGEVLSGVGCVAAWWMGDSSESIVNAGLGRCVWAE